jgi:probable HAF family extracellular repeat protein
MPSRFVSLSCLVLIATLAMALTPQNRARGAKPGGTTAAAFAISDLGSPRYRNWHLYWSKAYGINQPENQGLMDVIGWDTAGSAVWEARTNGGIVSRNNLAANMRVTGVNDHGVTVGALDSHLFANIPGVGVVELPESAGFFPASVNNLGHVVSQEQLSGYPELGRGAMWIIAADGTISDPIDLGNFRPLDINDWDEMAGLQDSVAAVAWFESGAMQVTKLPGLSPGNLGVATAINYWGEVVGYSTDLRIDTGTYRPFLWTADRGLSVLGSLRGIHGKALGINDGGQIVGWSYTSGRNSEQRAFLWESGKMFDLNGKLPVDSKRTLQSADDINNSGHIVGSMYSLQGGTTTLKSFLLTPTP